MKYILKLIVGLFTLFSFSQNSNTTDFYKILSEENDEISYTFIANYSNFFIGLDKRENKDPYCQKIEPNDSQKIIDLLKKFGVMSNSLIFQESEIESERAQLLAETRKLLIIIELPDNRFTIFLPDLKEAENFLMEIGSELNYKECFEKLRSELKKT